MEATLPKQQQLTEALYEALTGHSLPEFVAEKRAERRPSWSWRLIAEQIVDDTDGKVTPSYESLRQWYAADVEALAAERAEATS